MAVLGEEDGEFMGTEVGDEGLDVREGALGGEEEEILDVDHEEGGSP